MDISYCHTLTSILLIRIEVFMKYIFLVFITIFISYNSVQAKTNQELSKDSDACSMNFQDFHSPLDMRAKGFKHIENEKRNETQKTVTQTAVLSSGEQLDFSGGGCAHIAYVFTYTNLKSAKKLNPKSTVDLSIKLLKKTPSKEPIKETLLDALKKVKNTPLNIIDNDITIPCGDANCKVSLPNGNKTLVLSYDFAL